MKEKIKLVTLSLILIPFMWSCSTTPNSEDIEPPTNEYTLEVTPISLIINHDETSGFIEVSSNAKWELDYVRQWVTLEQTTSGVSLKFSQNDGNERQATFKIKTIEGNLSEWVTITQLKKPNNPDNPDPEPEYSFTLSESKIVTTSNGTVKVVKLTATHPWHITTYPDNVVIDPMSGNESTSVAVLIGATGPYPMKGEIVFESTESQEKIEIIQSQTYNVGDFWPSDNDKQALVFWTDETGVECKILSGDKFIIHSDVFTCEQELKLLKGKEQAVRAMELFKIASTYPYPIPVTMVTGSYNIMYETLDRDWYWPIHEELVTIANQYNSNPTEYLAKYKQLKKSSANSVGKLLVANTYLQTASSEWLVDTNEVMGLYATDFTPNTEWFQCTMTTQQMQKCEILPIKHIQWKNHNQVQTE